MEGAKKCNSGSASTDGTASKDVDGVAFLAEPLDDEGAMKTNVLWIVLSLKRHCCGRDELEGVIWGCRW